MAACAKGGRIVVGCGCRLPPSPAAVGVTVTGSRWARPGCWRRKTQRLAWWRWERARLSRAARQAGTELRGRPTATRAWSLDGQGAGPEWHWAAALMALMARMALLPLPAPDGWGPRLCVSGKAAGRRRGESGHSRRDEAREAQGRALESCMHHATGGRERERERRLSCLDRWLNRRIAG